MTRINTNVSSLNAQKTLARSNASLQESLSRLSTGLRINTGKDDPAGLIASEVLRSDIISVERAITNSKRANQMIATADSALGQVSSLLNDIRGLVSEAANTGAMSQEQVAANQLQIDSSLEAIDRIAQTTSFQGRRLLDGSLDFLTEDVNSSELQDVQIDQANFGSQNQIDVNVDVVSQATQASLNYTYGAIAQDVVLEVGGSNGFEAFSFASGSTIEDMAKAINLVSDALGVTANVQTEATAGELTVSSFGADNDIVLTAATAGEEAGDIRIKYTAAYTGGTALNATYTAASGTDPATIDVTLETSSWTQAKYTLGDNDADADNDLVIEAKYAGADFNGYTFTLVNGAADTVVFDTATKTVTITANGSNTAADIITAATTGTGSGRFNELFTIANATGSDGSGDIVSVAPATVVDTTGVDGGTILSTANDLVTELDGLSAVSAALSTGNDGHEVVTAFQESAYYGTAEANNRLQFLGIEDAQNVRFVSTPGNSLGVDLSTDPKVEGFASLIANLGTDKAAIEITAKNKGADYDDVTVKFAADSGLGKGNGWATWDAKNKTITITADQATDDVADILSYIADDPVVSQYFRATAWGSTDTSAVITALTDGATVGTTSGGLVSEGTVIVNLETDSDGLIKTTAQDLIDYFDDTANAATLQDLGISISNAEGSDGSGLLAATTSDITFATTGTTTSDSYASATVDTSGGTNAMFDITADIAGADYDGVVVQFEGTASAGSETVSYDSVNKILTIGIEDGQSSALQVISAINNDATVKELFTAAVTTGIYGGATNSDGSGKVYITDSATLSGGTTTSGTPTGVALLGNSDETNTGLTFQATEYGSASFVSVKSLNGASFATTDADGNSSERVAGTDVDALINGVRALGKGSKATINTSALDVSFTVSTTMVSGSSTSFSIVGGGALFQLGPDVVSNQQARLGISSVNTAKMGGVSGRLYQLRSGNTASLDNDVITAASIVEETITSIVNLRGRLGAFQRTTLDTNIASLEDTLENLTSAESDIRDADFAAESARLTRNQILVQSGTSVLSMANQNPQAVLSLLR